MRLDQYISCNFQVSRNRAQQLIDAKVVFVDGNCIDKSNHKVTDAVHVIIKEHPLLHWVSRSAIKLDTFLKKSAFPVASLREAICLDIGASTGGFTQVLLQNGAAHIDAVDVGNGQLHESLLTNSRVANFGNTDIRNFIATYASYDCIVADVSFISLSHIFPKIGEFSTHDTDIVLLFKPQFEVGKENISKTGIPKNQQVIAAARKRFEAMIDQYGYSIQEVQLSALPGEAGNQEWLYWIKKPEHIVREEKSEIPI